MLITSCVSISPLVKPSNEKNTTTYSATISRIQTIDKDNNKSYYIYTENYLAVLCISNIDTVTSQEYLTSLHEGDVIEFRIKNNLKTFLTKTAVQINVVSLKTEENEIVSLSKTNVIELTKLKNNYLTCIMLSLGLLSSATILYICYKLQLKNNVK